MHSRLNYFIKITALIMISAALTGCQDTIPNRSTITPWQPQTTGGSDGGGDDKDDVVTRPDNAVKFKTDFCGCKDGKAVTYGNCASFCAGRNTNGASILYANFNVTEAISLNATLGNVYGWCKNRLADEDVNPQCILNAEDDNGNVISPPPEVMPLQGTNSMTVDISDLAEDKVYVLTVVEQASGAKSDSIQIIKFSEDMAIPVLGPLKNAPISQYTCLYRPVTQDETTGDIYYDQAFRVHFYFHPRMPPSPIPAGSDIVCHDIFNPLYGSVDDALYPRLELIPGIFNLWDTTDPRFYDNNGSGTMDANDLIIQKARNFGASGIPDSTNFFQEFPVMTTIEQNDEAGNGSSSTAQSLGYYMAPWIDQTTFRSYCLNSSHYNSSNPLFKAMRDIIGVDTEGIYVGVKSPETIFDNNNQPVQGPGDFLLVRETDLKKAWFYIKNGVPTKPTESIVSSVAVYFYYPFNFDTPFVKSSTQRIYQVKGANELNNQNVNGGGSNSSGVSTNYPPHDRKIGCIPKF